MNTNVVLPVWLDDYIFNDLKANYCRSNGDMTVIDWDKKDVLNYLGTYFPRSYAESYCIFSDNFNNHLCEWKDREEITVFDFGCGTGGEIIGMLDAIKECLPAIKSVRVDAFDGNHHALRLLEKVIKNFRERSDVDIFYNVIPFEVDDFYDLSVLDCVVTSKYDVIMTFKAICEFVTKDRFERRNAYKYFARSFLPKLKDAGIMVITDVTTYNNVSQEWLPKMMDCGLESVECSIVSKNVGYNQVFNVSHSRCKSDMSKIAWRILQKDNRK